MPFPQTRLRRLRATHALRGIARETRLAPADLVLPLFIAHGLDRREPIPAMPGVDRLSIAHAVAEAGEAAALGVPAVLLFGIPAAKDEEGSGAWDDEGVVQLATRAIKDAHPDLLVITDVCLCEYTSHGHCGVVRPTATSTTTPRSSCWRGARSRRPRSGADIVAPSDMMDGRVGAIRAALDDEGLSRDADPGLLRQVRLRLLRSVPRGRRLDARSSAIAAPTRWIPPTARRGRA